MVGELDDGVEVGGVFELVVTRVGLKLDAHEERRFQIPGVAAEEGQARSPSVLVQMVAARTPWAVRIAVVIEPHLVLVIRLAAALAVAGVLVVAPFAPALRAAVRIDTPSIVRPFAAAVATAPARTLGAILAAINIVGVLARYDGVFVADPLAATVALLPAVLVGTRFVAVVVIVDADALGIVP